MKRWLVFGMAIVLVCLMVSACEEVVEEEVDTNASETAIPEPENTAKSDAVAKDPGIEGGKGMFSNNPNLKNGFQKMRIHKKAEQCDMLRVHLRDGEDNEEAWEKIELCAQFQRRQKVFMIDNVYLEIPYYRMNREYLEWLKEKDRHQYKLIKRNGVQNTYVSVIGSDDFEKIQMIYKAGLESDNSCYIGNYSVYNYVAGETLLAQRTQLPERGIEADKLMWEIDKVGYDCPWYLNEATDTAGIEIGMNMELFRKYFEEMCEDDVQSQFSYYAVQAEKGKGEELMQIVYKYFPNAWITR